VTRLGSVYTMRMARVNVYIPDDLLGAAKSNGLNVSALTQQAIKAQIAARSTDEWLDTLRQSSAYRATHDDVVAALDAERDAAPTRHA
jgi:post-segregation antitoxin (ccd killing protein)